MPAGLKVVACVVLFWICDRNSVDNRDVLAIAEQCLHSIKAFPVSHTAPQQVGWACTRSWEGTQPGQLTPSWPKGYSRPYDTVLSNKNWGKRGGGGRVVCAAFVLPIKLSLSQPMSFLTCTLTILLPSPLGEQWASSRVGLSCLRLTHSLFTPLHLRVKYI